jgi:hypothetical protein
LRTLLFLTFVGVFVDAAFRVVPFAVPFVGAPSAAPAPAAPAAPVDRGREITTGRCAFGEAALELEEAEAFIGLPDDSVPFVD